LSGKRRAVSVHAGKTKAKKMGRNVKGRGGINLSGGGKIGRQSVRETMGVFNRFR